MQRFFILFLLSILSVNPLLSTTPPVNEFEIFEEVTARQLKKIKFQDRINPKLIVLFLGTPGMGKTTLARILYKHFNGLYINSDEIAHYLSKNGLNTSQKDQNKITLLDHFIFDLIKKLEKSSDNHLIFLDRWLEKSYHSIVNFAKDNDYKVYLIRLDVDLEVAQNRIAKRSGKENHWLIGHLPIMYEFYSSFDKKNCNYFFNNNPEFPDTDLNDLFEKLEDEIYTLKMK